MTQTLSGRGLWYGVADASGNKRVFSETQWHAACAQAVSWGISILHPKIADGGYLWYDVPGLQMLKSVADTYHVQCIPYHYCYGDTYGALDREAQICAGIGGLFGGVSPDIENYWERAEAAAWATRFGQLVRKQYSGPIYPTVFANPDQHPLPWGEINEFATGLFPQVYFSLWSPPTAQHAIDYLTPQWNGLAARCLKWGNKKPLVPMLPIINLEGDPAPHEIAAWLIKMQASGYCGFWYDGKYESYAQTIVAAPKPAFPGPPPAPPPPVTHTLVGPVGVSPVSGTSPAPPPVVSPPTPVPSPAHPTPDPPTLVLPVVPTRTLPETLTITSPSLSSVPPPVSDGLLTSAQLQILWHSMNATVVFDAKHPIEQYWCKLVQQEVMVGAPRSEKVLVQLHDGEVVEYLSCDLGRTIVYFHSTGVAHLF